MGMSKWARFKKGFLLLAIVIMLLCAWPVSFFPQLLPLPPLAIRQIEVPIPPSEYEENYYDIYVNEQLIDESVLVLKDKNGEVWLPVSTFEKSNFNIPVIKPKDIQGQPYLSLSSFPTTTYKVEMDTLSLKITAPLEVFKHSIVDFGASTIVTPTVPPWGGFLNYTFFTVNQSNVNSISALIGVNIFGPYGVGSSTFSGTTQKTPKPYVRLLSTWTIDKPDVMKTLSIGDDVSASTNWSGSVNYGGIQWGTNFATQPTFLTFPLPGYRGTAVVPAAIDLFVNDSLIKQQRVAPGVFDITNIPMVDGYGNVRVITKDILGRQQIVNATYYINTTLLKKGLTNYTYDFGIIRQDLGIYSNNYSQMIGAITYGKGLTDATTAQVHAEALSYEQAVGLTLIQRVYKLGVLTGSTAVSKSMGLGQGGLAQLAFQRQTPTLNFGASTQFASVNFSQSGMAPGSQSPKWISQVFASYPFYLASLAMNYTQQINRGAESAAFITTSINTSLLSAIGLTFTCVGTLKGPPNRSAYLALNYAFNDTTSVSGSQSETNGTQVSSVQLIRQLPPGPGYGYDVSFQRGDAFENEASFSYQNDYGTYIAQGIETDATKTWSLDISGAIVYMEKNFKMSRLINGSFGFVSTAGIPDVNIYSQNQLIGISDSNGMTFVPNLLPYQSTKVNLDPNSVPLNTQIDKYEMEVIPYNNAGILIPFEIKVIRNAIITLKQDSGAALSEGAVITLEGNKETFLSSSDSEVFMTGLGNHNQGRAEWSNGSCTFSFDLPPPKADDPIPNIGTVVCKGSGNTVKQNEQGTQQNGTTSTQPQNTAAAPVSAH